MTIPLVTEKIARYKQVNVRRSEREYLLKVGAGEFQYQDLVEHAEAKIQVIDELFRKSDLPEAPDLATAKGLPIVLREKFYTKL